LDIGCGEGSFLAKAKKIGWKVQGIEPSPTFAEIARKKYKLQLIQDVFKPKYFSKYKFRVISMLDVIEHLEDPRDFIKNLKPFFREDGYFLITVPNYSSFTIQLGILVYKISLGKLDTVVKMITQAEYNFHHTFYFTMQSISSLLENSGFKVIHLSSQSTILASNIFDRYEFTNFPKILKKLGSLSLAFLQKFEGLFNKKDTLLILAKIKIK
jgi:2-polyprenyl-3-methyl-5-hydroxy-6-metoxy-1,4-benzoquinol methylase